MEIKIKIKIKIKNGLINKFMNKLNKQNKQIKKERKEEITANRLSNFMQGTNRHM